MADTCLVVQNQESHPENEILAHGRDTPPSIFDLKLLIVIFIGKCFKKQAGAELCQAQLQLERTKPALPFNFSVAFPVFKSEVFNN